jgi:hypothetical protein
MQGPCSGGASTAAPGSGHKYVAAPPLVGYGHTEHGQPSSMLAAKMGILPGAALTPPGYALAAATMVQAQSRPQHHTALAHLDATAAAMQQLSMPLTDAYLQQYSHDYQQASDFQCARRNNQADDKHVRLPSSAVTSGHQGER